MSDDEAVIVLNNRYQVLAAKYLDAKIHSLRIGDATQDSYGYIAFPLDRINLVRDEAHVGSGSLSSHNPVYRALRFIGSACDVISLKQLRDKAQSDLGAAIRERESWDKEPS